MPTLFYLYDSQIIDENGSKPEAQRNYAKIMGLLVFSPNLKRVKCILPLLIS